MRAFAAGLLFGAGLILSGMTQPAKVVGFLDVAGSWDPTLAYVLGAAVAVHACALHLVRRQGRKLCGLLPAADETIDARLLSGAALFGLGWGLAGLCPGPALAAAGALSLEALVFLGGLAGGLLLAGFAEPRDELNC